MKLTEEQIEEKLQQLAGWTRTDGKWIIRKYRFQTFMDAIHFVQHVAEIAETLNHHPFIAIDYKVVTLRMTSWHAGGLTELDFTAAALFDQSYIKE